MDYKNYRTPQSYYFCNNKNEANECLNLVINGTKIATSSSLWCYIKNQEKLPKLGDLSIITNKEGEPIAIIKVTNVKIVKFRDITEEYIL